MDIFEIENVISWSIVFIVTFCISYLLLSRKYNALESLGLPGPKPLPLIGNSLQDLFYVTHEKDIENIKKYGRVYGFYEGTRLTLRVSDTDILKEICVKQFNNFTDRRHIGLGTFDPILGKMLPVLEGDDWKTARNVMTPTFTSGKLKQMIPLFDKLIQKLLDTMAKKADTGESLDARKINWETIAQMTYMDMFISETLRKYPPGLRLDRQCLHETHIGELRIPKGTAIYIPAYAIHHDEEFYPDPEKFDPERFTPENKEQRNPYTYLAFGAGPRNCIAKRFALMEVKLTFIHMLKHFKFCRSPKTKEPLTFQRGHMQLKPAQPLHVILARR